MTFGGMVVTFAFAVLMVVLLDVVAVLMFLMRRRTGAAPQNIG